MFFSEHRLKMTSLRIGKHRIVKNIASLRKVNIAHPYLRHCRLVCCLGCRREMGTGRLQLSAASSDSKWSLVTARWRSGGSGVDHPAISAVAPPFARCRVRFRLRPCSAPLVRAQRIVATSRGLANFLYRRLPFLSGGQYSAQRRTLMYALDGPRCTPTSRLLCSTHTCTAKTHRGDKILTSLPTGNRFASLW